MKCLVACYIWVAGIGYPDLCERWVTKITETQYYYYVKVEGQLITPLPDKGDKVEIDRGSQKVAKPDCRK